MANFKKIILNQSMTTKIIYIIVLVLVLLIPASMITSLMQDREAIKNSAVKEINKKWGDSQVIIGPYITIPYKHYLENGKFNINYIHLLPKTLNINASMTPHVRYRSIYEAILYNSKIDFNGTFSLDYLKKLNINNEDIAWDLATFSIGVSDMRGIKDTIQITYDGKKYGVNSGLKTKYITRVGVSSQIPLSQDNNISNFSFSLNINGSEEISFAPLGSQSDVEIKSNWKSPSFNGAFLPTKREITDKGFDAKWKILNLNRAYPEAWINDQYNVYKSVFGLKLIITADVYQKSIRISKYALLFIVFTFTAFLLSEIISKKRIHPIQYFLIGAAIVLFYILLISFSEHIGFDISYLLCSLIITVLISAYSYGIIKSKYLTITIFAILSILYSFLYIILQSEGYSLLMGSTGLLAMLSIVMYVTRQIDWYSFDEVGKKED